MPPLVLDPAASSNTVGISRHGVTLKLPQLQNLCKRDPDGYRDDYVSQSRTLQSELQLLQLSSTHSPAKLLELLQFCAAVTSSSYKEDVPALTTWMVALLTGAPIVAARSDHGIAHDADWLVKLTSQATDLTAATQLPAQVRKTVISCLILLRNKGVLAPQPLLELLFRVMTTVIDKSLRETLYQQILQDVVNLNKKRRDEKLNRSLQVFFHRVVSAGVVAMPDGDHDYHHHGGSHGQYDAAAAPDSAAKLATSLVCQWYRKRVWTDPRTVAILATAASSANVSVMSVALRFFLHIEDKMAHDASQQQQERLANVRVDYHAHSKKTAARQRHTARQLKNKKRALLKQKANDADVDDPKLDQGVEISKKLYPAIELLHDPQGLAELTLQRLRSPSSRTYKFETKLLMLNFCTRLVGNHELVLLPLYPFLQRFLTGHQRNVTAVLAYTVQACHQHVPPDDIYGLLHTIAHEFITERCTEEQMAVGLNAVRAMCARVPSVLNLEEARTSADNSANALDLVAFTRDLAAYGKHRDRSVTMAAQAWINFVRSVHPALLQGKDRGLKGSGLHKAGVQPRRYGQAQVAMGVEGADLLVEYEAQKAQARSVLTAPRDARSDGGEGNVAEVKDDESDGWEEVCPGVDDDDDDDATGGEAPQLVNLAELDVADDADADQDNGAPVLDLSKMTPEERDLLKQRVSSTRIFTSADFAKMRKLVERERRAREDPREAARRKRAKARGQAFDELSGDDDDESDADFDEDDEAAAAVHVAGAVDPTDLMAAARRKRQSREQKLQKIIAGRSKFESKARVGGATNVEQKRHKNFKMTQWSREARQKKHGKGIATGRKRTARPLAHEAKKRRRKL